jgi:AcrR family transcriptional regulator
MCVPTSTETPIERGSVRRMRGKASTAGMGRVLERRRAVALARHYREFEGLSIRQIADRLGRSPATVKAYFYDPTGEKARAVKRRYQGGVPRLRRLHPAAERQGRRLRLLPGLPPRGDRAALDPRTGARLDARLARPLRPAADVTRLVEHARASNWGRRARTRRPRRVACGECRYTLVRTWSAARAVAAQRAGEMTREPAPASSSFGRESISLPKPRESTAKTDDLKGGELTPEPRDLQGLLVAPPDFAHNSGR